MTSHHILEASFAGAVTLATAASTVLMAQVGAPSSPEVIQSAMEMRLIAVPLMGGAFTMLGGVFLNPSVETPQVKMGRACIGMFVSVVAPQMLGWFHPALKDVGTNPFMLFLAGGVSAFLGFAFSRDIVRGIIARSGRITDDVLDHAESKYLPKPPSGEEPPKN